MSLNVRKCKVMHITRSRSRVNCSYFMDLEALEVVKQHKYLGMTISSDLPELLGFLDLLGVQFAPKILFLLFCYLRLFVDQS